MSDDKPKVSEKASEIAKNIWLAGLGAYGKAVDDAQDRLDEAVREWERAAALDPSFADRLQPFGSFLMETSLKQTVDRLRQVAGQLVPRGVARG